MFIFYALLIFALGPSVIATTTTMPKFQPHHVPLLNTLGPYVPLLGNIDISLIRGFWVRVEPAPPNATPSSWSLNKHLDEAIQFESTPAKGIEAVTFHQIIRRVRDNSWFEVVRKGDRPVHTLITDEKLPLGGYWGRAPELMGIVSDTTVIWNS